MRACTKKTFSAIATIKAAGFSLVEMMISITIGMLLIAGLIGVLTSNSRSSQSNDKTAELHSNGRYALDHLKRELYHAGYRAYTWAEPTNPPSTPVAVVGTRPECAGAGSGFVQNIRQGLWGANDSNPFAGDCLNSGYLRGDVMVIRRVASQPTSPSPGNTFYFQSTYSGGEIFQGSAVPATVTGTPLASFELQEYVYYIGSDDNDASTPALRRIALQQDGSLADEMVVSGIENLQVQYGVATTDLNTQYYDANAIAGSPTDTDPNEWDDVHSVRIWLLARNSTAESGYTNTNTYQMGDVTYDPPDDGFRRQLFTTTVYIRN